MEFDLEVSGKGVPADLVRTSVLDILSHAELIALGTADQGAAPHVAPVFYAIDTRSLTLFYASDPNARHSRALLASSQIAGAVYLTPPTYGEHLRGVQLDGHGGEVRTPHRVEAFKIYQQQFPTFAQDNALREGVLNGTGPLRLYRITVAHITALDEPRLGRRRYARASVIRRRPLGSRLYPLE